jgi:hypothetical protein
MNHEHLFIDCFRCWFCGISLYELRQYAVVTQGGNGNDNS